ncbi:MAG: HlyD family efflux transporter periplasmic adaptor subunit, partial [Planctomycetota bacterium]|nr:HlyD family efflux transporter periplasmic adaptor subunit [Planctomycetota bacterium]
GLVTGPDADHSPDIEQRAAQHFRLLDRVSRQAECRAVSPQSGSASAGSADGLPQNPTDFLLLLCPVAVDNRVLGVLELFQRPNVSPGAVQGFLRFLGALAELAADFLRNSQLRDLQDRAAVWSQFEQFSERVHEGLDVEQIASSISNDGRHLIGCDRLTVAVRKGSKFPVVAVSGLDSIDRRSNVVRAAQELIHRVIVTREPFWYQDVAEEDDAQPHVDIAPQLDDVVHRYLDESPARLLAVFPLIPGNHSADGTDVSHLHSSRNTQPVGAILIERFEGVSNSSLIRHRSEVVARQSASTLGNALQHSNLPFLPLLRLLGRVSWYLRLQQLPKSTLVLGILAAILAALVLVPADFTVEGQGELQPAIRRGVFASSDGVVASLTPALAANEPTAVAKGETLIELSNTEFDFELTRVLGELRTAQQSLITKKVERLNVDDTDPNWQSQLEKLSAEEKELEVSITSLDAQLKVLRHQQQELILTSPIDGQILTWEAARILENRPVRRGDLLVEVADVAGPWVLEIQVPDQNIGFVNAARRELKPDLDVSFILATDPKATWHGTVRDVASDTRSHGDIGPAVLVTVEIDRGQIHEDQLRPGTTVIPHIHTGERSIGFVWFHELIHTIRTKVLF